MYLIVSFSVPHQDYDNNDYTAGIILKHKRLNSIKTKTIIFAGGSNLAFGINSAEIESELKTPVVNFGLHAGLGLSFILEELKQSVKNGDVIFLSPEYMLKSDGDYKLKKLTGSFYPESNRYYSINYFSEADIHIENTKTDLKNLFSNKKKSNKNLEKKQNVFVYSRDVFNAYGDVIGHFEKEKPQTLKNKTVMKYRYWEGITLLNEFKDYAETKNIKVYFLYPNYPASEFKKNHEVIAKYSDDISKNLQMPILNTPSDFVYNDSLFFDTTYHLTKEGREKRTKELIRIIKEKKVL